MRSTGATNFLYRHKTCDNNHRKLRLQVLITISFFVHCCFGLKLHKTNLNMQWTANAMTLSEAETRQGQITQYARNDSLSKEILKFQDYKFWTFLFQP